ncbi:TetR/AcrR family transcriptional regulator [Paenibacillus sp. GCM10027626]|uniref:TetR/AcrR family transcriptional regulator n=1 Tax=Paenibacillus sp. GCM10027626 TaxID=3273411 RepID=UPI0036324782
MVKGTDDLSKEIMRTARQLFERDGVEAVSMHKVAKTLGIGQGTLYRRYPNKGNLCFCIMEARFEEFKAGIYDYLLAHAASASVMEKLAAVMRMIIQIMHEDLAWIRAVTHTDKLEEARSNLFELPPCVFLRETIQRLLEEAAEAGQLRPLDPAFTASLMISSLRPELIIHLEEQGYQAEQIADHFIATLVEPLFEAV